MNDVIVPSNDIVRRPSVVPEAYNAPSKADESARFEKNPFFEKGWKNASSVQKDKRSDVGTDSGPRSSRALVWALGIVVLLGGGFAVANYFSSATIEITPITRNLSIDQDFTALASKIAVDGDLVFNFATSTETMTKEIPATVEKKIQKKASGKVIIYNAYNRDSQRLIKNTRLEDDKSHKIFRIDESVVVPGMKVAPGQVEALVYADVPGKEYNIGTSNFHIPGFKGDPRYSKFYAVSKPDAPIEGGFSGTVKVPSDTDIATAQSDIDKDLLKIAVEKIRANIPSNMTLFPGGVRIKFEDVPPEFTMADTSKVSRRAVVSGFFFETSVFTARLAELLPPEDKGKTFTVSNMSALDFKFVDPVDNIVLADLSKVKFHIKGEVTLIGQVDTNKLREVFVGKNKKDFTVIVGEQSNIGKANAVIRPMWKTVFPTDSSKITVKVMGI